MSNEFEIRDLLKEVGDMKMKNDKIIKEIDELIMHNRVEKQYATGFKKDIFRKNNDMLGKVKTILNSQKDYERGANDAWELAKKIDCYPIDGGWDYDELHVIFDSHNTSEIFKNHTFHEALAKVKAYEKKKEEEAAKLKFGDVVEVISNNDGFVEKGIFLSECFNTIKYLNADGVVEAWSDVFKVIKTGEHVDIQGILDKIGG